VERNTSIYMYLVHASGVKGKISSSSLITVTTSSLLPNMSTEKTHDVIEPAQSNESINIGKVDPENDGEIFKRGAGYEDFRTVGWIHTAVIFLKRECCQKLLTSRILSLIIYSHLCNWCLDHPLGYVHPRITSRSHQRPRMAISQHLLRARSRSISTQPPWLP